MKKNLPKEQSILDILSARFIHDPQFLVMVNNKTVPLEKHSGFMSQEMIETALGTKLEVIFMDSTKAAQKTLRQGIAFWVNGRLVGSPSWVLGAESVIDGRTKLAKRYTVVVKANDLTDCVLPDWTGFIKNETMEDVYKRVAEYVDAMFSKIARENIAETSRTIRQDLKEEFKGLSSLSSVEVNEFIETVGINVPTMRQEHFMAAVEAVINLEKTRSGADLLKKLATLSEGDIEGLNRLLEKWSVRDALTVLDEIDKRLTVLAAIEKLSADPNVDELTTLHPLMAQARWMFGVEFESAEYVSNKTIQIATELVFKKRKAKETFVNYRNRADLVVIGETTYHVVGTESYRDEKSVYVMDKLLIIELKKGGFKISRDEMSQAGGYVQDFLTCSQFEGISSISAFVVGHGYGERFAKTQDYEMEGRKGKVMATTFGELVSTGNRRLCKLREKLNVRYENMTGQQLMARAIQPELLPIPTNSPVTPTTPENASAPKTGNESPIIATPSPNPKGENSQETGTLDSPQPTPIK